MKIINSSVLVCILFSIFFASATNVSAQVMGGGCDYFVTHKTFHGGELILPPNSKCILVSTGFAGDTQIAFYTNENDPITINEPTAELIKTSFAKIIMEARQWVIDPNILPRQLDIFFSAKTASTVDASAEAGIASPGADVCVIVSYASADMLKKPFLAASPDSIIGVLAHEYFHCLAAKAFPLHSNAASNRWWNEGIGDAFASKVIPNALSTKLHGDRFKAESASKGMVEQRYSNEPFMAWLLKFASWGKGLPHNHRLEALVSLTSTIWLPDPEAGLGDELGNNLQRTALSKAMSREDAAQFMQSYADGNLTSLTGLPYGIAPAPVDGQTLTLGASASTQTISLEMPSFRTFYQRFRLSVATRSKGSIRMEILNPDLAPILMIKREALKTWNELPYQIDLDCGSYADLLVIGMSTSAITRDIKVQFELNGAKSCNDDPQGTHVPTGKKNLPTKFRVAGHGNGDPHYVTADGAAYTTQKVGEFWALDGDPAMQIQVRHEPWLDSKSVAAISAVAFRIGGARIGLYTLPAPAIFIDGKRVTITRNFQEIKLTGGGQLKISASDNLVEAVTASWPDGSSLYLDVMGNWIDLSLNLDSSTKTENHRGLFGNADDNIKNDLTIKNGTAINQINAIDLNNFVDSWRIMPQESLFDYLPGRNTASYQDKGFPYSPAVPKATTLKAAHAECMNSGVIDPPILAACAFDIAMTGEHRLLQSHLVRQQILKKTSNKNKDNKTMAELSPDFNNAVVINNDTFIQILLNAGETRTFAVDVNSQQKLVAYPESMECVNDYNGEDAGYQWFDIHGQARSKAKQLCSDLVGDEVKAGRYYIVVKGPANGQPITAKFRSYLTE